MSPLTKYWATTLAGVTIIAVTVVVVAIGLNPGSKLNPGIVFAAACLLLVVGVSLYSWGAAYIGRCPTCSQWITNRLTLFGFWPYQMCRGCGRDLTLAHAPGDRR